MSSEIPDRLAVIAGNGAYPRLLAESAKAQGVQHLLAIAFRRETDPAIGKWADETRWITLGQYGKMLDTLRKSGVKHAVMAGQITPTHLFRIRLDKPMLDLLRRLPARNAETIFGAVAGDLRALGIELLPASSFMQSHMVAAGLLSQRAPTETEQQDIRIGFRVARAVSALDIGQTVVVKQGTVLAAEAFEGTNEAIRRAGRLGGPGAVVVKLAKRGHDMRFDIPVVGPHTLRILKKIRAAVFALEAGRAIVLEKEKVIETANNMGLCLVAMESNEPGTDPPS